MTNRISEEAAVDKVSVNSVSNTVPSTTRNSLSNMAVDPVSTRLYNRSSIHCLPQAKRCYVVDNLCKGYVISSSSISLWSSLHIKKRDAITKKYLMYLTYRPNLDGTLAYASYFCWMWWFVFPTGCWMNSNISNCNLRLVEWFCSIKYANTFLK